MKKIKLLIITILLLLCNNIFGQLNIDQSTFTTNYKSGIGKDITMNFNVYNIEYLQDIRPESNMDIYIESLLYKAYLNAYNKSGDFINFTPVNKDNSIIVKYNGDIIITFCYIIGNNYIIKYDCLFIQ